MIAALHNKDGFFKYYTADSAKLTLRATTRKWSTPFEFNDPFDNQFDLFFEEPSDELAAREVNRLHEILTSPVPPKPGQFGSLAPQIEIIRQALLAHPDFKFTEDELADLREGAVEGMRGTINNLPQANAEIRALLADTSIFCVSETHDNLLMWSHYAQNHTGAVIKFLSLAKVDSPLILAQPVRYSARLPRIEFSTLWDLDAAKKAVYETITLSKSDVWSYEREWRIVTGLRDKTKPFEILPFAPQEIGAVYLGCKMTDRDRQEIIGISRQKYPTAKIFQAVKHESEYALNFTEIA
ncbi:MAG TPA: DUF2971 domain-containing protein [Stellaceae bacterium]|nr:DUF2971 domain-containing protein [Stellaceae bacterium]